MRHEFEPFAAAFEAIGTPVLILTGDRVARSNGPARATFGGEAALADAPIESLLTFDDGLSERARLAREGHRGRFEVRWPRGPRDVRRFDATLLPLGQVPDALVLTLHDVTDDRQTAEDARIFYDLSRDMLSIVDTTTDSTLMASAAHAKFVGFSPEEIRASPSSSFTHPDDISQMHDAFTAATAKNEPVHVEVRTRRKDGSYVWVEMSSHVAPNGLIYTAEREIDARRKAEERLRSILANAPGFIVTCAADGKIVGANRPPAGLTMEDIVGANIIDMTAPEHKAQLLEVIDAAVKRGAPGRVVALGPGPEGMGTYWFDVSVNLLEGSSEKKEAVLFIADIHRYKLLEAELEEAAEVARSTALELEEKNGALAREIEERRAAEAALLHQQEALRSLSTPILQVWRGVLALPVVGVLDEARATHLMERLLHEIVKTESLHAILDLTGVEQVDQETAHYILDIAKAARLLGSECLLSGMSPAIAQTMVGLDVDLQAIKTFGELEDALAVAIQKDAPRAKRRTATRT
jgi:rsbT co-antagonist protein RsbR